MEQTVDQLVKEFQQKVEEAERKLESYNKGEIEFTVILEYIQVLTALAGNISVTIGDEIRRVYTRARKARQDKNIMELGYFVEGIHGNNPAP